MRLKTYAMNIDRLALGVLDISAAMSDPIVANKYRDLTISWSRYDYRGEIMEAKTVNAILDQATARGHRWCLILPYGHIIAERWTPEHWQSRDLFTALKNNTNQDEFLVAGVIVGNADSWFGFEHECLLVNLEMYQRLSAPSFDVVCEGPIEVPAAIAQLQQERIAALRPTSETEISQPSMIGWNFVATSLRHGVSVIGFDQQSLFGILDLSAKSIDRTRALATYLNHGIGEYHREAKHDELGRDQEAFLNMVHPQTSGARNGVFLWNIEPYDDVEKVREDFQPPLNSLYSVAAGFKPNRILETHGWNHHTRVVYFDYSPNALEIRKFMVDHWNGEDFPDFVERLVDTFPHPDTFYQLWDNLTPNEVDSTDIQRMWQRELDRWGTAEIFRDHWRGYRELEHEYICCDILTDPVPLWDRIFEEPSAVIWWSNAFFTVHGNWFYTLQQRSQMYQGWIRQLARLNPDLFLFGSDYNNINVNSVRAVEYWDAYRRHGGNCLIPCRLSETEIRM